MNEKYSTRVKTIFDGTYCTAPKDAAELYDQNGYGRVEKDGRLRLEPEEALYLAARGKIDLKDCTFDTLLARCSKEPSFLRSFIVYRDIRERGFVITVHRPVPAKSGEAGNRGVSRDTAYRIFPRGQRPGKGTSRYLLRVLSERDPVDFASLIRDAKKTANMRKQFVLAVLDDEHEITYYEIRLPVPAARECPALPSGLSAKQTGLPAFVTGEAVEALQKNWFGTMLDASRLYLSPVEVLWLMREGHLTLDTGLSADEYFRAAEAEDPEFSVKFRLYCRFKALGYYPRSGYKYGHHFRVYTDSTTHSEMLAQAVPDGDVSPMWAVSRSVRLAHSVKKRMLFVILTGDEEIPLEFARIKM